VTTSAAAPSAPALRAILKSQYHAALAMLRDAIEKCPDDLWKNEAHEAPSWGVAYHALYFAHLYGSPSSDAFRPWARHVKYAQYEDGIPGPADPESELPLLRDPLSRADVLEYWSLVDAGVDAAVDALDLASPESGFSGYRIPKLEHQIVNIRHIEHHAAQLAARIRMTANVGVRWVGACRKEEAARPGADPWTGSRR
jgi:hypothetical protein